MNKERFAFRDQRKKYAEAVGFSWLRRMIEEPNLPGTVLLTDGPGILAKLCPGFLVDNIKEIQCMLILSQKPQRVPSFIWNDFNEKFGTQNTDIIPIEIVELREGTPVVHFLDGYSYWKYLMFEDDCSFVCDKCDLI